MKKSKKSPKIFRKNLNLICHVVYTSWKKVINEFDLQNWVTFWVEDIMLIFFPWLFRESILGSWNVSSLQSFFAKATRCANMKTIYLFKKEKLARGLNSKLSKNPTSLFKNVVNKFQSRFFYLNGQVELSLFLISKRWIMLVVPHSLV